MPIRTFTELLEAAKEKGPKVVAVAAGHQSEVMLAGLDAELAGLAEIILVGDSDKIREIADREDFDISRMDMIHAPEPHEAAWQVMKLVSEGKADIAMKGRVETSEFLRAALSKELVAILIDIRLSSGEYMHPAIGIGEGTGVQGHC